jgi:polyhydroxyalkanoate synthesis regulator phasin
MKRIPLFLLTALLLVIPQTAFAAGNTTTVEQKWLDFQKAVTDQMVKDGVITKQEADSRLKEMQTKFAESPGDSIYQFFSNKKDPGDKRPGDCKDGTCKSGHRGDGAAYRAYSAMTGKTVESLQSACSDGKTTIWDLAKKEGKLDELKSKILSARTASLDALVQGGLMTQDERNKILARIKEELDKK